MSREKCLTEDPQVNLASRQLLCTLYRSFYASQGYDWMQERMLVLAGAKHHGLYTTETRHAAYQVVRERIGKLALPGNHPPAAEAKIREQFDWRWSYLAATTSYPQFSYNPYDLRCANHLSDTLRMAVRRDVEYMQTERYDPALKYKVPFSGRPVGESGRDPRQSFVRDYILGGLSLKDPILDDIYADMRTLLTDAKPPRRGTQADMEDVFMKELPKLADGWELHHPGEAFVDLDHYRGTMLEQSLTGQLISVA